MVGFSHRSFLLFRGIIFREGTLPESLSWTTQNSSIFEAGDTDSKVHHFWVWYILINFGGCNVYIYSSWDVLAISTIEPDEWPSIRRQVVFWRLLLMVPEIHLRAWQIVRKGPTLYKDFLNIFFVDLEGCRTSEPSAYAFQRCGIPSKELTYPTLGKGKSSSKCHFWGIC